jgi:serine/threonine protein phosphatase PrpC
VHNGEENLVPSTEKKSRSKNSANSIPTSSTRMRLMMTSTHLAV